ncbi:MAG: sigma-70 family RNA polymerase sigma factor [Myxococcota bacterium]
MSEDRLIEEHRELVHRLAHRLRSELDLSCEVDDLIAYGMQGLIQARNRFDPSRGVQFSTFAHYRVRGAILDGVRQMAYLPRRAHRRLRVAEATDHVAEAAGDARRTGSPAGPGLEDTASALDGALSRITAAFTLAAVGQDSAEQPPSGDPEHALLSAEAGSRVREAVDALPERERALVRGFYFEGRRFDEVAAEIGISKSWASRLHAKALGLLRDRLSDG